MAEDATNNVDTELTQQQTAEIKAASTELEAAATEMVSTATEPEAPASGEVTTTAGSPGDGKKEVDKYVTQIGDALDDLHDKHAKEYIDHPAVFDVLLGMILMVVLYFLYRVGWRLFAGMIFKKELRVKMDDGSVTIIKGGAIRDLERIATRDLGTAARPKLDIRQKGRNLVVKARMNIFENQKGPEMKQRLEESLRREFQDKHGIEVSKVLVTLDKVKQGEGPISSSEVQEPIASNTPVGLAAQETMTYPHQQPAAEPAPQQPAYTPQPATPSPEPPTPADTAPEPEPAIPESPVEESSASVPSEEPTVIEVSEISIEEDKVPTEAADDFGEIESAEDKPEATDEEASGDEKKEDDKPQW